MTANQTVAGGFFLTLEGPEGAGKSTQATRITTALRQRGFDVLQTREPGGTPLGEELRRLVKHFGGPGSVCPETELLLFGASRAQLMQAVLRPHLERGGIVVCDRFADSTTVYQGCARGLDAGFIEQMHHFTVGGRWPDLTCVLDLDTEAGFGRTRVRNGNAEAGDRIEAEPDAFHRTVREGFLKLAAAHPERIRVIDASATPEAVFHAIMEAVNRAIG